MSRIPQGPYVVVPGFHRPEFCEHDACPIHHPSAHHMRDWPLNWRGDRQLMERICPHGVGHPDPDHMHRAERLTGEADGVHGCDGCCAEPASEQKTDDQPEEGDR